MIGKTNAIISNTGADDSVLISLIDRSITSVQIPDSVTEIGDYAFSYCKNLESVALHDGVTSIKGYAFFNCTSLTSIDIPDSVTSIGEYAFGNTGITGVGTVIPSGCTVGGRIFYECTSLTDISDILSETDTIYSQMFHGCTGLTEITIPVNITTVWGYAFQRCSNLQKVTILGIIDGAYGCFSSCRNITELYISNLAKKFDGREFNELVNLADVTLESGFNGDKLNLSASTLYTAETIVSWLNALYDRTGLDTYTLTIGAANLAKLTEEQIAIATAKNWTLA